MVLLDYVLLNGHILKLVKKDIFPFKMHRNIEDHIFGLNYSNIYYIAQS